MFGQVPTSFKNALCKNTPKHSETKLAPPVEKDVKIVTMSDIRQEQDKSTKRQFQPTLV